MNDRLTDWYLEHREQTVVERVKIGSRLQNMEALFPNREFPAKNLGAEEGENSQEEKEEDKKRHYGLDWVDQRG